MKSLEQQFEEIQQVALRVKRERDDLFVALDNLMSHWGPYNPGHSDLDNEQPESIPTTMGEIRKIHSLLGRIKPHEKEQR